MRSERSRKKWRLARRPKQCGILAILLSLCSCASIFESREQKLQVNTVPPGASCKLLRSGVPIGEVNPTPGAVLVRKSTYDIVIVCDKDGYQQTSYVNASGVAAATVGSAILGGATGVAIDSMTGTANKYDGEVTITLLPNR
jgi:hypothetical protein